MDSSQGLIKNGGSGMDILKLNEALTCPNSDVKIVAHVIGTGVNEVGPLARRVETIRYADIPGDTSRTLGTGRVFDYSDRYGANGHETGVAYLICHDIPAKNLRVRSYNNQLGVDNSTNRCLAAILTYVQAHPSEKHIVNMSFKCSGPLNSPTIAKMHSLIQSLTNLNVAVVCSAGNDGKEALDIFPSNFEEPWCIAAVHADGTKAPFSVWHWQVDFTDLGVSVPILSKDGDMYRGSGTSFSAPIVCNKIAKIWCANPELTEAQLYEVAKASALDLGSGGRDPYFGWGWIASVVNKIIEVPVEPDKPIDPATRLMYLTTPRMSGSDVYGLELQLEALGYDCKISDGERSSGIGVFGPACDVAVRAFQKDYNVDVYGKVGMLTLAALKAVGTSSATLAAKLAKWVGEQVGHIYVWGAQGENLTNLTSEHGAPLRSATAAAWIKSRETNDENYERALRLYNKRFVEGMSPILAYDCGGLIVCWLHKVELLKKDKDMSSRSLYAACTPISRSELKPGSLVFRHNGTNIHHVGVYIGDGLVVEAMGRDEGVVTRNINDSGSGYWNRYGNLKMLG